MEIFELKKKSAEEETLAKGTSSKIELLEDKVNDTHKIMEEEVEKR